MPPPPQAGYRQEIWKKFSEKFWYRAGENKFSKNTKFAKNPIFGCFWGKILDAGGC
jgi:hypothetical protein